MLPLWGGGRRSSQQAKPRATFRGGSRGLDEALPEPWHAGYGPLPLPTCTCAAGVLCQHTWSFLWGQWLDGNIHSIEYQAKSLTTNNKMFNASTSTPDWTTESAFTPQPLIEQRRAPSWRHGVSSMQLQQLQPGCGAQCEDTECAATELLDIDFSMLHQMSHSWPQKRIRSSHPATKIYEGWTCAL